MELNKLEGKATEPEVLVVEDDDNHDDVLPGFRFHPTDEELVEFYLRRKIEKKAFSIEIIKEIDIYKYDPWDLPKSITLGEKEWYFFCLRGRKYRNSIRPNRVTGSGFWKATGVDRPIYSSDESSSTAGACIGLKKSLVYYRGSAGKGTKTDWMMHEFRLPPSCEDEHISPSIQEAEIWTICRILKRNSCDRKYQQHNLKLVHKQQQQPTESSSKTSSFCSEVVNDHQYNSIVYSSNTQGEFGFNNTSYHHENNQNSYVGQSWNSIVQTHSSTAINHSSVPNSGMNELSKDGTNWDELGRIMDFMMTDQPVTWL